jgi:signal transduction histidine kinase
MARKWTKTPDIFLICAEWNLFTIDTNSIRLTVSRVPRDPNQSPATGKDGRVLREESLRRGTVIDTPPGESLPIHVFSGLADFLDAAVLVADRAGRVLIVSNRANEICGTSSEPPPNLFDTLLRVDPSVIIDQMERGEREVNLQLDGASGKARARIQWLPGTDWLMVRFEASGTSPLASMANPADQPTVQALQQEREITYRNLLAAYLRLQEVNRQKTVFLGSAAHELKTPLAVIKGYYDLLLSDSLGRLNDKQRDILQESKDSCERLVRLVSMFLNYSTLESGKLVLHLRENDLRDCLSELATRWNEAFQRKHVRLEISLDPSLVPFKFDYQKVQQSVANLLDNALKHTSANGSVTLLAEPHFWERRGGVEAPPADRRRQRSERPNSVRVAVTDTGTGIAPEHHQEIFEDFVRVDRTPSGMGLGLAIAKRLVQAHRGKIWVDSEPRRGCTFTFLLPTDNK